MMILRTLAFLLAFCGAALAQQPGYGPTTPAGLPSPFLTSTYYYPQLYGTCIWDGTHDVSSCIQSAITAAEAAGNAEVILPGGVLPLGATCLSASSGGFKLRGQPGTVLRAMPTNSCSVLDLSIANATNVTIEDVVFDGGAGYSTASISGATITLTGSTTGAPAISLGRCCIPPLTRTRRWLTTWALPPRLLSPV